MNGLLKERLVREAIEQLKYFKAKGLTHLDQVEKFIETNKLKTKQLYDKNSFNGGSARRSEKVNGKWTQEGLNELSELIADPEAKLMRGKQLASGSGAAGKLGAVPSVFSSDEKWAGLSNKEKVFV